MEKRIGFETISAMLTAVTLVAAALIIKEGIDNLSDGLKARADVGTYALYTISDAADGGERLYRINTVTGRVWGYDESVVLTSEALGVTGKEKESLDALISQAAVQGNHVYTMPFWWQLDEENDRQRMYTTH